MATAARYLLLWLAFSHAASSPVAAQQTRKDTLQAESAQDTAATVPRYRIEGLTVTVTRARMGLERLPYAISVLTADEIRGAEPTISLDESLAEVPGVWVSNRHNYALGDRISIRGFGSRSQFGVRGIRVLQDGIPLTLPDGQAQLGNVDLGAAGRIEVIRGTAASLYGNAAGGVISIETMAPPPATLAGEVRALTGSLGDGRYFQKYDLRAAGQPGDAGYVVHTGHFRTDGFRPHSAAERTLFNARVRYRPDTRSRLTAVFNYANTPLAQNPSSLPRDSLESNRRAVRTIVVEQDLGETSTQGQAGLRYERTLGDGHSASAMTYALFRELENPIPFTLIRLDRIAGGARLEYRYAPVGAALTDVTAGVDLDHQRDDRRESFRDATGVGATELDQAERVTSIGAFGRVGIELADRLELTGSARYDRVRFEADDRLVTSGDPDDSGLRIMNQLSPMIGLSYGAADWLWMYVNVGRSFQTPTTTELTDSLGGFNAGLEPERATTYELGLKGLAAERARYSVALFASEIGSQLIAFRIGDRDFFRNAGSSRHLGAEASVSLLLVPGLTLEIAYTHSDFDFDEFVTDDGDFGGNEVPGVPPHRVHGKLALQTGGLSATLSLQATDGYFVDNANRNRNDAYAVLDLRLSYRSGWQTIELTPFLGVDNALDAEYISSVVVNDERGNFFEPAPGRQLYGGLRARWQP